jgi:hypothetical protein
MERDHQEHLDVGKGIVAEEEDSGLHFLLRLLLYLAELAWSQVITRKWL